MTNNDDTDDDASDGDQPIPEQHRCNACRDRPGSLRNGQMLCDRCFHALETRTSVSEPDVGGPYGDVDANLTNSGLYPPETTGFDNWMHWKYVDDAKRPWWPFADEDKFKWSRSENLHDFETAKMGLARRETEGLAYIVQPFEGDHAGEADPFLFVDCDDVVRDDGTIHPDTARLLNKLGPTYMDVSTSGDGLHLIFRGRLPRQVTAPVFDLPWEEGSIEIYDGKRVCLMTGEHVEGTPERVQPVDGEGLIDVLREHYDGWEEPDEASASGTGVPDGPVEPDPDLSRDEVRDMESTDAFRDVIDAIAHVTPSDIRLRSTCTETYSNGRRDYNPSFEHSDSGARLGYDPDGPGWIRRKGDIGLDALQVVALEERIITSPYDYPSGDDWWEALDELRARGAHIPEYDPTHAGSDGDDGPLIDRVVLPDVFARGGQIGWGVSDRGERMTRDDVYDRTEATIEAAMMDGGDHLIHGMMGCGKTYSSFKVAADRDDDVFYACARTDLYEQAVEYAMDVGIPESDIYVMPSFFADCPTANGAHGDVPAERVARLHSLGVRPKSIHTLCDLPCTEGDQECPYHQAMSIDPDEYQVIIGHYKHTHLPQMTSARHVIVDESPADSFMVDVEGDTLITSINTFLGFDDSPPFDDFEDLLANRTDPERRAVAYRWFEEWVAQHDGWEPDERNAVRHELSNYHALTPRIVYGILDGEPIGDDSPWLRANINGQNPVLFRFADQDEGYRAVVNTPPANLNPYASSLIGLDGTPMLLDEDATEAQRLGRPAMWNLAFSTRFQVDRVLTDAERYEFLVETQDINIIQTTEYVKPYSSGRYANQEHDFALLEAAAHQYGFDPTVIAPKKVIDQYESEFGGLDCSIRDENWFGNLRGSNRYQAHRLGVILGSPHYGDEWLARQAALLGSDISPDGKGTDREYGSSVGDALLKSMRESSVAQAALRFGRDGNGAIVCVHTSAVPEWLPISDQGRVTTTWTKAQRAAIELATRRDTFTAGDLAAEAEVTTRQANNVLNGLHDRGILMRQRDPDDGRRYVWEQDGEALTYGETSLPADCYREMDTDPESAKGDVHELLRDVSYKSPFASDAVVIDRPRDGNPIARDRGDPPDTAQAD